MIPAPEHDRAGLAPGTDVGRGRILLGGAIGHFIEWYDWAIYGFLAGVFAVQMFPADSAAASLIASFSAFAIGFIGRPVGAFVLSPLADKYGRRTMLSATIVMAGLGSLVIALCPTYAQIGAAAPLVIILARLLQGFSAGGEYQIAITFLNEHASRRHRALAASPQQLSIGLSVLAATAVSSLATGALPPDALAAWGWRVPFLLGAVLSLFGLYLRSGMPETPAFEKARVGADVKLGSILASIRQFPKEVFIVFVIQMNGLQYYLWLIFLPTYANIVGHLDRASGFAGSILASIAYCIGVPVFAAISDRIGRKPFLIGAAVCFLVFTYPLLSMLAVPNLGFGTFAFVAVVGSVFVSLNNAVLGTVFAELFPTRVRTSGIGIPYAVCAAIFGGTAPAVATWLQQAGGPLYIALYVMAVCLVTLLTHLVLTPETRGRPLD
ncbi:MFS transporter [Lichenibacterium ramalinae]|uniref:MFS transporter n=1 Tax=Lichenibacterium ramalinae TaxID=2316527 RepID=A0A4Q2RB13_9HYPH|nr:MFS transporter [Lichenibacterium ramalinae]RYB04340.1 MFS transporter [Lichenibacterium ramalinae]